MSRRRVFVLKLPAPPCVGPGILSTKKLVLLLIPTILLGHVNPPQRGPAPILHNFLTDNRNLKITVNSPKQAPISGL